MKPLALTERARGQVLPLFALILIVLMAMAALAIDVSSVYSAQRFYKSTGDAAALAGGQDLQQGSSRTVTDTERTSARTHAMAVLVSRLGATSTPSGGTCAPGGDIVDCALPGTSFIVSIKTPSPTCVRCDPDRSVQVAISNPEFSLTFARLLGQNKWNVGSKSVAGLAFAGKYALMTLRPPNILHNGLDQNRQNIDMNGTNVEVRVLRGDIGTNTSAYTNAGNFIYLAPGYRIDHVDDIVPDPWNKDLNGNPRGRLIPEYIRDPNYPYAAFPTGATDTFTTQVAGETPCTGSDYPNGYTTANALGPGALDPATYTIKCYRPGLYEREFIVSQNTEVAYLMPGAYYFEEGLDVSGALLGGLISGSEGVVLVLPQDETFAAMNAVRIWLNIGDEGCATDACRATPAIDWSNQQVKTPEGFLLTVEVERDSSCYSGTLPQLCNDNQNNTIQMPGNGHLQVAGVIYAPSDRVQIQGDQSTQVGVVGQLVTWTVTYGGGAKLNQDYPGQEEVGILRLDAACTAPTEPCNP